MCQKLLRVDFEASKLEGAGNKNWKEYNNPKNENFPYQVAKSSIPNKLNPPLAYPSAALVIHSVYSSMHPKVDAFVCSSPLGDTHVYAHRQWGLKGKRKLEFLPEAEVVQSGPN